MRHNFWFSPDEEDQLATLAEDLHISQSKAIRLAIAAYTAHQDPDIIPFQEATTCPTPADPPTTTKNSSHPTKPSTAPTEAQKTRNQHPIFYCDAPENPDQYTPCTGDLDHCPYSNNPGQTCTRYVYGYPPNIHTLTKHSNTVPYSQPAKTGTPTGGTT